MITSIVRKYLHHCNDVDGVILMNMNENISTNPQKMHQIVVCVYDFGLSSACDNGYSNHTRKINFGDVNTEWANTIQYQNPFYDGCLILLTHFPIMYGRSMLCANTLPLHSPLWIKKFHGTGMYFYLFYIPLATPDTSRGWNATTIAMLV